MTVRNGHGGFFSDTDLRELSGPSGILWSPETAEYHRDARLDPPKLPCGSTSFSRAQVDAWFEGRPYDCFGAGYEDLLTHTRTRRGRSCAGECQPRYTAPEVLRRGDPLRCPRRPLGPGASSGS